jgi:hypothetical protein
MVEDLPPFSAQGISMKQSCLFAGTLVTAGLIFCPALGQQVKQVKQEAYLGPINVNVPAISTDKDVKYDYDIVYVRVPREGDRVHPVFAEVFHPTLMDPGGDLMLLKPDGTEEVLVAGGKGAVVDPYVSFDGAWVYYAKLEDISQSGGSRRTAKSADIFKIHVKSRKIVQLTQQEFTPNTGAGPGKLQYGVFNLGPCPLPGGKVMFTSNRNAFRPNKGYTWPCLQLFVMDDFVEKDEGGRMKDEPGKLHPSSFILHPSRNVEMIGYINLGSALHPTILRDGRVMFSSYEAQGLRDIRVWGLWSIHPDGTNWEPVISALFNSPNAIHFQTQLSDGSIVAEDYYNLNNSGFGPLYKLPERPPPGTPGFGPAYVGDPRNPPLSSGRLNNGKPRTLRMAFSPHGIQALTPFANNNDNPADLSVIGKADSPRVGKFTHPSGAPDNHLLAAYAPGPANHHYGKKPESFPSIDSGIYLIKDGKTVREPAQMRLIKNDPKYNEQWPRALVPYIRVYGIDQPKYLTPLANDGKLSPHLPEGTPFGLVGASSLYKRESFPNGVVAKGSVTADWSGQKGKGGRDVYQGWDPFNTNADSRSWTHQGAEAGRYDNSDIHAIRILAMEGTTDHGAGPNRRFFNHANERLRILGEIPVRHFRGEPGASGGEPGALATGGQPIDPDNNPDTSFLAKIPADVAFTFQTLDKNGMVLNMAQTWHQVRPGEIRNNCGGCHAHSQQPTDFKLTMAARADYKVFDLTKHTPLLTNKAGDQSKTKWDVKDETGLRFVPPSPPAGEGMGVTGAVVNVEYFRDIKPIFDRSCVACHTNKWANPAGKLVLDDQQSTTAAKGPSMPGTYVRLAMDKNAEFGHPPLLGRWTSTNASRYVRMFQSRRSLLIWKVYGQRLDGWGNDDFPTETVPGDAKTLKWKGKPLEPTKANIAIADLDYTGPQMPPPEAVAGTYVGPDSQKIKVAPLSDEDRRTLARWIDLGCPIDLDKAHGWMCDDQRPTLTMTYPRAGKNASLSRILIGMHDHYSGLDMATFKVTADFAIDGVKAGENLASRFQPKVQGVRELVLNQPLTILDRGKLTVSVIDKQGNVTRVERAFSVGKGSG